MVDHPHPGSYSPGNFRKEVEQVKTEMLPIESDKLKSLIYEQCTPFMASISIGRSHTYFSGVFRRGKISKASARALYLTFGIMYADYRKES